MRGVAVIGAGRIGTIHAGNAHRHDAFALKYVVDPVASAAGQLAGATGARVASFDDVLSDAGIEGVIVASSTDTHLDFSLRAAEAGKAVFCEKPLDLDIGKARSGATVLASPGARFLLGFNRRFDPNFGRLKERLDSGEMGPLETLHIVSHDPAPPPIAYVKVSGGLFLDMAIHDFDTARWLMREEFVDVYASGACLVDPAIAEAGDIDTAKTILRTRSGRICVISNSRRSGYGYDQRIEAFCAKGLIRANNIRSSSVEAWAEAGPELEPLQNFFLDRYREAYASEMAHFAQVLTKGLAPAVTYGDGIAAMALAEAARESARSNAVVRLAE